MNPIKPVVHKLGPPPRANVPVSIGPQSLVIGARNPSGDPVPLAKPVPVPPTPPPPPLAATTLPPPIVPVEMPLPPPVADPVGYDGYMAAAMKARSGAGPQFAQFWATMAQAEATKMVAAKLEGLLEFVGFYDEGEDENHFPRLDSVLVTAINDAFGDAKPEKVKKSKKKD